MPDPSLSDTLFCHPEGNQFMDASTIPSFHSNPPSRLVGVLLINPPSRLAGAPLSNPPSRLAGVPLSSPPSRLAGAPLSSPPSRLAGAPLSNPQEPITMASGGSAQPSSTKASGGSNVNSMHCKAAAGGRTNAGSCLPTPPSSAGEQLPAISSNNCVHQQAISG
jgi:hypothetical protein